MAIIGDYISGINKQPLLHVGANQTPTLLVVHYSVTDTVAEAVAALNKRKLSYHVLIAKDGKAYQTRSFKKTALHPGLSNWKATGSVDLGNSVSRGSIGICLMNNGFGYKPGQPHVAGKLIYNPNDASMQQWETYPKVQLDSCRSIAGDIIAHYAISDVVGHHDIAIMGKFDPGPLFNLGELKNLVTVPKSLGLMTSVKEGGANLLQEAKQGAKLIKLLAPGTTVYVRSVVYNDDKSKCLQPSPKPRARYLTRWASIDIDGSDGHAGFIDLAHLTTTPLTSALEAYL